MKKGTCTVGVQRQYTGTAGRIENSRAGLPHVRRPGRGRVPGPGPVPPPVLDRQPRPACAPTCSSAGSGTCSRWPAATGSPPGRHGSPWVATGIGVRRAIDLAVRRPAYAWRRSSAGHGAHGERFFDWALIDIKPDGREPTGGIHLLLIRRNRGTGELAFYRVWTPRPVTVAEIVRVAGTRWNVEEDFQTGKELTALDEHQVRRWTS